MRDLTQNSISRHLFALATPAAAGMLAQVAYHVVDLYFVAQLGSIAIAGVNAAGNVMLIVAALTQILGTGTAAAIAQAVGRKDLGDANLLFNQSVALSLVSGLGSLIALYAFVRIYLRLVAADEAVVEQGIMFINWVLPGYALLLPWTAISSALRGTGVVHAPMLLYASSVLVNALLAPVLITGWGTHYALGVRGAGLATSLSIAFGIATLVAYTRYSQQHLRLLRELLLPRWRQWLRIVAIGGPTGADFVFAFVSTAVVYFAIRDFGAAAQAGFGIGWRVLQMVALPAIAIGLASAPIAGQNFGAGNAPRVQEVFRTAALMSTIAMVAITLLAQWRPTTFVRLFAAESEALAVATLFLQFLSWSLVAQGLTHVCSSLFQGLGNTVPALIGSAIRVAAFATSTLWLTAQHELHITHIWQLLAASIVLQTFVSLWLLRIEFCRRLPRVT